MEINNNKLEELLLEHGLLKPEQLDYVRRRAIEQHKTVDAVIIEEQLVYPEPLAQLKAEAVGVPYLDLQAVQIDAKVMQGVAAKAAATFKFIAFSEMNGKLQVAMAAPEDVQALEAIRFLARKKSLDLEIYCASAANIEKALTISAPAEVSSALSDFRQELEKTARLSRAGEKLDQILEDAPVSKVFAVIMRHAIEGLASDIHIEPFGDQLRVRYRIDSQLHTTLLLPIGFHRALMSRVKVLANLPINATQALQEGRFTFNADRQSYSVRIAVLPTINGEKITMHLIDTTKMTPSFDELGMSSWQQTIIKDFLRDPRGLAIVSGPDGSGKSTTINALLAALNTPGVSLATVEETIEYELPGVTQTQVLSGQELSFAQILQHLLRQDVEIIMAEEIRNQKIAHLLTKGALAGRLMLSAIHAQDALRVIPQLVDLGISYYVLSSSLRLILAQRLAPKLCQMCKKAVVIPKAAKEEVERLLTGISAEQRKSYDVTTKLNFYQSTGCPACHERKTRGQMAIFEIIPVTKELSKVIAEGGTYENLQAVANTASYLTLRQDGLLKALQGLVNWEDVVRVTA